jgi:peptide/nickel transport system substrate-binding protein
MIKLLGKSVVLLAALFVFFLRCADARDDSFVMTLNAAPISLDPAVITDYESAKMTNAIYEGLVRYANQTSEIEPCLATSWKTSDDGRVWTFYLRKDVLFHDGTVFDAEAVVFSFARQIDRTHAYFNHNAKYARFALEHIEDMHAVDAHTLVIRLKKPYAPFLANLAMPMAAPIVSPAAVRRHGPFFEWNPVGTGPYLLSGPTAAAEGTEYVLDRNDGYWGGGPRVSRLHFRVIKSTTLRFEEFQRGAVHVIDNLKPSDIPKIRQMPGAVMVRRPGMNVAYLAMNTLRPPFDNVLVRRAVNHAINKTRLIRFVYQSSAAPAATPVPPTIWGHNGNITDYDYDPGVAAELLAQAGWADGFDTNIHVMTTPRPYMPAPLEVARIIQQNLAALGIKATIISYPWREFLERVDDGEHDMCLLGWVGDNGDPDNFLYTLLDADNISKPTAMNRAFFNNGEVHDLLLRAQETCDVKERSRLYERAQEIIHDQAPWVPLAHAEQHIAHSSHICGLIYNVNGSYYYHKVYITDDR